MRSVVSFLVASAVLIVAAPCRALEKTAVRMTDGDPAGDWTRGYSDTVMYYNICTGWIWVWGGWSAGDIIGTCYEGICGPHAGYTLFGSMTYFESGMPAGYGFTGTVGVQAADANMCPTGGVLATAPLLPVAGWNYNTWGIWVPSPFVVTYEFGPATDPDYTTWESRPATDHPAPGPTGPAACGLCYPTTRVARSFHYGSAASPLCPGSTMFDGVCDANFLALVYMGCKVVSVEESSWGSVKNLYR